MFLEIAAWLAAAGLGLEPSDNFPTGFLHDSVHRRNFETQKMGATISRGQSDWCLEQKGRHQEPQSVVGRLKAPLSPRSNSTIQSAALAYELISQLSDTSSNSGVVHSIGLLPPFRLCTISFDLSWVSAVYTQISRGG